MFHHFVPLNVKHCNGFEFSNSSSPPVITASHFVYLLVGQLHVKEVLFCSFVTKSNNPILHAPNIYPHVFNSFHRIIIHGESHRIFKCPSLQTAFPTFHHITSSFCCLPIISSLKPSKKIGKPIHNLPSWETTPDRHT